MINKSQKKRSSIQSSVNLNKGMTLPELIVSVILLGVFTGLYIVVVSFINRFYTNYRDKTSSSQGFLIDQHQLSMAMNDWVEILSQPGYTPLELKEFKCEYPPTPPRRLWNLMGKQVLPIPEGYRVCLKATSLPESPLLQLITPEEGKISRPGIYILYAIPDLITSDTLPVRRIFCRPKVYC